jgi:hypothetical protein
VPCCYDVRVLIMVAYSAGFGTHFGALNDEKTHLAKLHENLLWVDASLLYSIFKWMTTWGSLDSSLYPAQFAIIFKSLWRSIPEFVLRLFLQYLPSREFRRFREYTADVRKFGGNVVKEIKSKGDGKGDGQYIMSALMRANASENPETKLTDEEIVAQVGYVMNLSHQMFWKFLAHAPPRL